jgi:hypothetical protein
MINLLPYDTKQQTRAARINLILIRYIIYLCISAGFLTLACLTTYLFINNSFIFTKTAVTNTSSNKVQGDANIIKTNLANAKNILDQQVSYSEVISAITVALPSGTKLNTLSINDGSFGTTTTLSVLATKANLASSLKTGFSNPQYFSNYILESTTSSQDPTSKYPFTLNISITINKVVAS